MSERCDLFLDAVRLDTGRLQSLQSTDRGDTCCSHFFCFSGIGHIQNVAAQDVRSGNSEGLEHWRSCNAHTPERTIICTITT